MPDASARAALLVRLAAHVPSDDDEARGLATLHAFVAATPEPFSRATLEGHVTTSAMLLDADGRALLLFHAKLALWVQPGGHVEPGDASLEASALREAREESGLSDLVLALTPAGEALLLDVDVHPIPTHAKRAEPAHFHHDLCYLVHTRDAASARLDPEESHALRWVAPHEVDALTLDRATRRRLHKAFATRKSAESRSF